MNPIQGHQDIPKREKPEAAASPTQPHVRPDREPTDLAGVESPSPWRPRRICLPILVVAFAILAFQAHSHPHFGWDLSLAQWIQSNDTQALTLLMAAITWLGEGISTWTLVIAATLGLWLVKDRAAAIVCAVGVPAGSGVSTLLKSLVDRPRPAAGLLETMTHYQHQSFPSGHVFFFVDFFGFMLFIACSLLKPGLLRGVIMAILVCLIILVGVSRIYLGAHWPSDVAGGYLGGGVWLILVTEAYDRLKRS